VNRIKALRRTGVSAFFDAARGGLEGQVNKSRTLSQILKWPRNHVKSDAILGFFLSIIGFISKNKNGIDGSPGPVLGQDEKIVSIRTSIITSSMNGAK